jgi:acetyl-CoA synthetase
VELETAVVECVPNVIEAAAVGVPPPMGGPDELVLFLVLRAAGGDSGRPTSENNNDEADLRKACQNAVSSRLNPLFRVGRVQVVGSLPRNASNKVMRRTLRERALKRAGGVQQGADAAKL